MPIGSISGAVLRQKSDRGDPFTLLDVREDHERACCAIRINSKLSDLHIPMREVPSRYDEIREQAVPIVVYCHHGVRSMVVARWLASRGVEDVLNLDGGIDAWSAQVDPTVPRY